MSAHLCPTADSAGTLKESKTVIATFYIISNKYTAFAQ
jgi:hypothetical protein